MANARASTSGLPYRIGRHDVLAYIATGGMAELFLGKEPSGTPVVIKRILPHLARQGSFVSMFIDEGRIGSLIRHPNLVEVFELGQVGTDLFLVMEYLAGENLSGVIRRLVGRGEHLPYALAAHIAAEACLGLAAAHELTDESGKPLRVVHRDVSPSNLFVTYDGGVKILDFGIATAAHRLTQTATGQLKGKFSYMSPEQCHGEALDARSDLFSLGVVLYELTMLRRLFKRTNELMVLQAVTAEPIPRPSRERADYPRCLEAIVTRALSRDRDGRYATAREMHADLVAATAELGGGADLHQALQREMERLFVERMRDKGQVLDHVRAGSSFDALPSAEVDESIDVPQASLHSAQLTVDGSPGDPTVSQRRPRPRRVHAGLWAALALALCGIVAFSIWRLAAAVEPARVAAPAPAPPVAPRVEPIEVITPPPAPPLADVLVTVDSTPRGAAVLVDGVRRGQTPIDLRLPRDATRRLRLELRLAGYTTLAQDLSLDRDQRFVLALVRAAKRPSPPKPDFRRFD